LRLAAARVRSPSAASTNGMSFCTCALMPSNMSCAALTSELLAASKAICHASGIGFPRAYAFSVVM
jgi:hypothetical protein